MNERITNPWRAVREILAGKKFIDIQPDLDAGGLGGAIWYYVAGGAAMAAGEPETRDQLSSLESWSRVQRHGLQKTKVSP